MKFSDRLFVIHAKSCSRFLVIFILCSCGFARSEETKRLGPDDLRKAAAAGDLVAVDACLSAGVPVDSANAYGVTALLVAADHQQIEVAKKLLQAGANPGIRDRFYGFTPLAWAIIRRQYELVTALAEAGAPDTADALTRSVYSNSPRAVDAILGSHAVSTPSILWAASQARVLERKEILEQLKDSLPEESPDTEAKDLDPVGIYAGFYESQQDMLKLEADGGSLFIRAASVSRAQRLTHLGPGRFEIGMSRILMSRESLGEPFQLTQEIRGGKKILFTQRMGIGNFPDQAIEDVAEKAGVGLDDTFEGSDDFNFKGMPWSGFRGHLSRGISDVEQIPIDWNIETGQNVAWKAPIEGLANSCPIVWGSRVYLTTAVSQNKDAGGFQTGISGDVSSIDESDAWSFRVICLDLKTGEVIWDREAHRAVPAVKRHAKSSHANPTPVTDGEYVVASFGSEGVYCYDRDGDLKWKRSLGRLDSGWFYDRSYQWGYASSPCLIDDRVIIQCDIQDQSFLVALDLESGDVLWRTERDEIPTWGTPVAYKSPDGLRTVVVSGTKENAAYDLNDGKLLWKLGGFSEIVAPTPQVLPSGLLLAAGYPPIKPIAIVKHNARGELVLPEAIDGDTAGPDESFLWAKRSGGPYMSTPIIYEGLVYTCDTQGVLSCLDAATGTRVYRKRLRKGGASSYTGSPVAAGGYLYFPSEQGVIQVVRAGVRFEQVAALEIGEATLSSPAISGGYLIIRGESHLFAFKAD
ncbi:MAG: PQQ-binding-like beta-propeller repeat protein [Planctomycetota bacterium]